MSGLIYDETALVDSQMYKYDKFMHSRINKYTDQGRTLVTYFNINDAKTTTSLGMDTHYQVLGNDSPLRFDKIDNMMLIGFTPLTPEETQASNTPVRNYGLSGEAYIIPSTIMPKENDFFIVNHLNMNHLFRVTQVSQDGLTTDGSYKINYALFSTNVNAIDALKRQVVGDYKMDLQTIGGSDLTPVVGKTDYELRSRLIAMMNDMVESYIAQFYDPTHNCFICHLDFESLFDVCGNMFMQKQGVMIRDNTNGNVVLNPNKIVDQRLDLLYQKSPYKWIERDAPLRYLDTFKYHLVKAYNYPDSSFALYGMDLDIMIPNDPWCNSEQCDCFFPPEVHEILNSEQDIRTCTLEQCKCCCKRPECNRDFVLQRYDYISLIHDFIHGKLTNIQALSLYTGDQLFDNTLSKDLYLWTPIVIYIIQHTLKIK